MLSRVWKEQDAKPGSGVQPYRYPTLEETRAHIEERRREHERQRIIEAGHDDPVAVAKREAGRILAEAQERAKNLETEAALTRERVENEVRTRLEKEFQGRVEAEAEKMKKSFADSLVELAELKDTIYGESEDELLNLAYTIIKRIIGDEVKTSPNTILNMLRKGFEKIKEAGKYDIRINPDDYDVLLASKERVKEVLGAHGAIKFIKDEAVERGGCKIITETGEVSSEPSQQLGVIIKELRSVPAGS